MAQGFHNRLPIRAILANLFLVAADHRTTIFHPHFLDLQRGWSFAVGPRTVHFMILPRITPYRLANLLRRPQTGIQNKWFIRDFREMRDKIRIRPIL